jgi:hypothetical protein
MGSSNQESVADGRLVDHFKEKLDG